MNKKFKITLCAVLCASMLAGCADNSASGGSAVSSDSSSDTQTTSSVSESTDSSSDTSSETSSIDESKLTEEQIYDNMVERSLMDLGNLERMSKFIGKLESKQEVTIAFIGGSITEGLTAGPEKCWAKLTYDRLCEKYPDTKINYVNAGLSGTPSVLGNIRLQRDVLDHKPDMVFVEFAVNDGNDQIYKDSYGKKNSLAGKSACRCAVFHRYKERSHLRGIYVAGRKGLRSAYGVAEQRTFPRV